jgi:hypothetical protein
VNKFNRIFLTIAQLDKQPSLLSQIVANAIKQRRRKAGRHEHEFDLDQLRNPSMFLAK